MLYNYQNCVQVNTLPATMRYNKIAKRKNHVHVNLQIPESVYQLKRHEFRPSGSGDGEVRSIITLWITCYTLDRRYEYDGKDILVDDPEAALAAVCGLAAGFVRPWGLDLTFDALSFTEDLDRETRSGSA